LTSAKESEVAFLGDTIQQLWSAVSGAPKYSKSPISNAAGHKAKVGKRTGHSHLMVTHSVREQTWSLVAPCTSWAAIPDSHILPRHEWREDSQGRWCRQSIGWTEEEVIGFKSPDA